MQSLIQENGAQHYHFVETTQWGLCELIIFGISPRDLIHTFSQSESIPDATYIVDLLEFANKPIYVIITLSRFVLKKMNFLLLIICTNIF